MKTKKLLSILMALMMMLSVVPFYASAAAETLTTTNVQTWPTLSYKHPDGVMYYGMTVEEGLTINDDEVVLDAAGNQVAGHFEFVNPSKLVSGSNIKADLLFVPDDTDAYSTIKKNRSSVLFSVQKTQLVLIDENNPPVAVSQVVKGGTLSTVELTGGQVKNPYVETDSRADGAYWKWVNPDTVVTESGEFEATLHTAGGSYETMTRMVYVEVESSIEATTIVEAPTATLEYGQYFSEAVFEGGKVMAGDKEVSGTFTRKSTSSAKPVVGVFEAVEVIFTPDDLEKYAPCEGTATVTVTKANYKFVNENGEEIVPELTLPYGTTFNENEALGIALKALIKDRAQLSGVDVIGSLIFEAGDYKTVAPVGTNTYNVRVRPYNSGTSNYNVTDLQFILTIEPATVEVKASSAIGAEVKSYKIDTVDSYAPYPQGTFDVYIDGALYMEDVKGSFPFDPGKSGEYEIRMVYNPVENDPCVVPEKIQTITETYTRNLKRSDNILGGTPTVRYGKEVTLRANVVEENFGGWRITDANGNEITLEGAVLEGRNITFTMPDFDISVEAIDKTANSGTSGGIGDIFGDFDLGDLTEGDSDNEIINIFNNLIALFKNIIEKITGFFRAIGDRT